MDRSTLNKAMGENTADCGRRDESIQQWSSRCDRPSQSMASSLAPRQRSGERELPRLQKTSKHNYKS